MKGKLGSNVPMQPSIPKMPSNTSNALEALDSVNETQFNALDSISRQAAKDMIKNHKSDFSTEKDYRTARACVNAVPPAQPQIIRCKDCKYREYYRESGHICVLDTGDPYMTGRNAEDDDWFCADAEREKVTT